MINFVANIVALFMA